MNHEKPTERPQMTRQEWWHYCNEINDMDDPQLAEWMESKNLKFDQGLVEVEVDGRVIKMETSKSDFGTEAVETPPPQDVVDPGSDIEQRTGTNG